MQKYRLPQHHKEAVRQPHFVIAKEEYCDDCGNLRASHLLKKRDYEAFSEYNEEARSLFSALSDASLNLRFVNDNTFVLSYPQFLGQPPRRTWRKNKKENKNIKRKEKQTIEKSVYQLIRKGASTL